MGRRRRALHRNSTWRHTTGAMRRAGTAEPEVEPGTGPLSNEAVEQRGEASPPEVEPGTGPLSNEAVEQRGAADQQGSGDLMAGEAGSAGQSCAPASDEMSSVSGQYSPASDELDVESGSAQGGSPRPAG